MATITATPAPGDNPYVNVDLAGFSATEVRLYRLDVAGNAALVRNGDPLPITGGIAVVQDYETPLDVGQSWEARDTLTGAVIAASATVTLASGGRVYLGHPGKPSLNTPVVIGTWDPGRRPARSSVHHVIGRALPVARAMRRAGPSGSMRLRVDTFAELENLAALLDDGQPLLLRTPASPDWGIGAVYLDIGDVGEDLSVRTPFAQRRWLDLPWTQVSRPAGLAQSGPGFQWANVMDRYATWAAERAANATWADLLGGGTAAPEAPAGTATVTTYTPHPDAPSQTTYQVSVNGQASHVYPTLDSPSAPQPHWGKFTCFSMSPGDATVVVTTDYDISSVRVRPTIKGITATVLDARHVQFVIAAAGDYSVEFNADPLQTDQSKAGSTNQIDPLFVFASPAETAKPSPSDPDVYAYFAEGGLYTGGSVVPGNGSTVTVPGSGDLVVPAGKKVYIEGGAYFRGRIIAGATSATGTAASGITVDGRGVVDATWQATPGNPVKVYKCSNTVVSNIIALSCNKWAFRVFGCGATGPVAVNNVRVLSWADPAKAGTPTPDGIDIIASSDVTLDGVFVRSRDDAIAVKNNKSSMDGNWSGNVAGILVRNFTVWNGNAGNGLEIGYETGPSPNTIRTVTWSNGDIIHKTTDPNDPTVAADYSRGAIAVHNQGTAGDIATIRYEDIRIEDVIGDAGATTGGKDGLFYINANTSAALTDDIYLKNISVIYSQAGLTTQVRGGDSTHRVTNVTFENLVINGTVIADNTIAAANGYLSSNVTNVVFVPTQGGGATPVTLGPAADAWVRNNATASGVEAYLRVKNSTSASVQRRSFLRFDATAASLSTCTAAKLRLWLVGNDKTVSTPVGAYSILDDTWTEAGITWANQPALDTLLASVSVGSQQQYYEWDVTAFVAAQLAGDKLISLALWDPTAADDNQLTFNAREAAANNPQLVITP